MYELEDKLIVIIKKYATNWCEESVGDNTDLINDIGYDSISIIQLLVDLEAEFEIEFDDTDLILNNLTNYGLLKKYISKKSNQY